VRGGKSALGPGAAITLLLRQWIVSGQMQLRGVTAQDWGRSVGFERSMTAVAET
jgi:hypothetical protein